MCREINQSINHMITSHTAIHITVKQSELISAAIVVHGVNL